MRPSPSEYFSYFERYVCLVTEDEILSALQNQVGAVQRAFGAITPNQAGHRYAPGKWTVREVFGHVIDTERVLGYRALCVARGETTSLPEFDENQYEAAAQHDRYPLSELIDEFSDLRRSHLHMFRRLESAGWEKIGCVNGHPASTRALAFVMVGHLRHHANVLSERYGIQVQA